MMMILRENEVCPYGNTCIYNTGKSGPCWGAKSNRNNSFHCEYVVNGRIMEGGMRLPDDRTGKMQIIME
jgi:hypothetical protein